MSLWSRRAKPKSATPAADTGKVEPARKQVHRSPPAPLEVKLLAVQAMSADVTAKDVAAITGVAAVTVTNWRKQYRNGGIEALCHRPSSNAARKVCEELEQRIVAYREAHPDRGVRRIRDDLRRNEGLEPGTVSAVAELPTRFALHPNYPNPFNPSTTLRFDLPQADNVELTIYDVTGRRVRTLVRETLAAGRQEVVWQGRDESGRQVASGVYLYKLKAGSYVETRRMTLVK